MKDLIKPTLRTGLMLFPLMVGIWVYSNGEQTKFIFENLLPFTKERNNVDLAGSLPDYFWYLSLLVAMILLWNGWNKIPNAWKITVWVLVCSIELLQYLKIMPGTGDIMDLLVYQVAFATVILLQKPDTV